MIRDGCKACPANEDVWLEAARLQTRENAKMVLAEAVKKIPQSVKIWLQVSADCIFSALSFLPEPPVPIDEINYRSRCNCT